MPNTLLYSTCPQLIFNFYFKSFIILYLFKLFINDLIGFLSPQTELCGEKKHAYFSLNIVYLLFSTMFNEYRFNAE